jgi:hypothetical protein
MSALSTLQEGRAAAERELLHDLCVVTRPSPVTGPRDPETGVETPGVPEQIYSGPGWLKMPSAGSQAPVGGDVVIVQRPTFAVSVSAPSFLAGDSIRITDSPTAANVGRELIVASLPGGDFIVLARYEVQVITG